MTDNNRFMKKPIIIEAEQYLGDKVKGVCDGEYCEKTGIHEPHVHTIHNSQVVLLEIGDWIIPEPDGIHYYPVKPDIFNATYEKVD